MTIDQIVFDASVAGIDTTELHGWGADDPQGRRLRANRYHLTLDGAPFPVVSGEFIPQRYPASEWRDALIALRDAGCTVVSSYVFWSLVEPRAGEFDFTGANDIRRFAQLCGELGLLFAPRIGPFNNSEYLLGGLPPWLYGMALTERSNDARYLERVAAYFARVADQFDGLYWSDGGPIVIVQLENELAHAPNDWRTLFGYTATDHRGPEDPEAFATHMRLLRSTAVDAGITPPFFAMTAWGLAGDVSDAGYLPTYGAYMDLHPHRDGNHVLTTFQGGEYPYRGELPTAFCELGTGSPTRAAYRPMTAAGSTVTTALTRFAAVETLFLGYYLFHGGTNPVRGDGFGWTTKEPAFPLRSYDFWAPVSEFGERRETFGRLLPLNRFVRDFGSDLATTEAVEPVDPVIDPQDARLRTIVRANAASAFVFFANYGNNIPLADRTDVRLEVRLADRTVTLPRRSTLTIASGETGVLPIGLPLGHGVALVSATAQPLARTGGQDDPHVLFHAPRGAEVEFTISGADHVAGGDAGYDESDGRTIVATVGDSTTIVATSATGSVRITLVPTDLAERHAVIETPEGTRLIAANADLSATGRVRDTHGVDTHGVDGHGVEVSAIRPLADRAPLPLDVHRPGLSAPLAITLGAATLAADAIEITTIAAGRVLLRVPDPRVDVTDLWADIAYTGDLARLFDAGTGLLIADDFNRGIAWRIRLGRFAEALYGAGVQLRVEPVSTVVEVPNDEGILLDHAEQHESDATVDAITFAQRVRVTLTNDELFG